MIKEALIGKLKEALISVMPVTAIVLIISLTPAVTFSGKEYLVFVLSALLMILGIGLFNLGADLAMTPMGEHVGEGLTKSKQIGVLLSVSFVMGVLITVAEPDLTVLAGQGSAVIQENVLIFGVGIGVGLFLLLAVLKILLKYNLNALLFFFYMILFMLAAVILERGNSRLLPLAFDSGGVTTGPVTVPFIMAMGAGLAAISSDKNMRTDSFGLVSLCSVGPILCVLLLSLVFSPEASASATEIAEVLTTKDALNAFLAGFPVYLKEVLIAFSPIAAVFVIFQLVFKRFQPYQVARISIGMIYTLVLFLTAANIGFMPAGSLIGSIIAGSPYRNWLVPVGMIFGFFIVAAEPAVVVLKKQVEEISNGAISQRSIGLGLSIGVSVSVGLAMLRVLTGIPIQPFLYVGYAVSLGISFFVPPLYTSVAFDAGGVASGPMTSTFILPFAVGACTALGGNVMTDAFGIVALVAMAPLITIQSIGLVSSIQQRARRREKIAAMELVPDTMIYYEIGEPEYD